VGIAEASVSLEQEHSPHPSYGIFRTNLRVKKTQPNPKDSTMTTKNRERLGSFSFFFFHSSQILAALPRRQAGAAFCEQESEQYHNTAVRTTKILGQYFSAM